jgi:hypothetical protein
LLQIDCNSKERRIATEITEPALLVRSRTLQLSRLQSACELLRKVIRFLYLARKLKGHLQAGTRELAKSAQCVLELGMYYSYAAT